ncbi:MAG: DUF1476 domain-containing protein [Magnetovibrionaceae bacterium]
MSDKLREREMAEEAKYKMDEELRFKAESRRTKLFGLWVASKMNMPEDKAADYAKEMVMFDLDEPGVEDIIRKAKADLEAKSITVDEQELRAKTHDFYAEALAQLSGDYPEPLGNDHARVGD